MSISLKKYLMKLLKLELMREVLKMKLLHVEQDLQRQLYV